MPTTDAELAKLQETVQSKRQEVADVRLEREARERELSNDVAAEQLKREISQLDAIIETEKTAASEETVAAGVAAVLDPVAAQQAADAAHEAAIEEAVVPASTEDEKKNEGGEV